MAAAKKNQLVEALFKAQAALELIATPARPDGTFNRGREACLQLASDTLAQMSAILQEKRSRSAAPETPQADSGLAPKLADEALSPGRPITVYSDGGCKGNPGPAGWGVVVVQDGYVKKEAQAFIGVATNQVAELSAAVAGLRCTPVGSKVELVSDSQYVLNGISSWRKGWEARGWTTATGGPVLNKAVWQALFAEVDKRTVTTRWVRGHSGNVFNERCDALASKAIECKIGG